MPTTLTLSEVLFAVHFRAPLNINVIDVAAFAQEFSELPIVQQQPLQGPASLLPPNAHTTINFQVAPDLPRLVLRSASEPDILQFQSDRFVYSWSRLGPLGSSVAYPGYERLKYQWIKYLTRFNTWARDRFSASPQAGILEISYFNTLPHEKPTGGTYKLSEVFKFVQPGRIVNGFAVQWLEVFDASRPDTPRVHVNAGFGAAQHQLHALTPALFFNFTGYGPIAAASGDLEEMADALHQRIVDVHAASITSL